MTQNTHHSAKSSLYLYDRVPKQGKLWTRVDKKKKNVALLIQDTWRSNDYVNTVRLVDD